MKPIVLENPTPLETGLDEKQLLNAKRNQTGTDPKKSLGRILFEQIFSYFNLVNYLLAAIILFTGSWRNLLFMLVVISNTAVSLYQEIHSRRILNKLALLHQQKFTVLREGKKTELPADQIAAGDLIYLKSGSQIPCDGVIRSGDCQVNESLLTGEADPLDRSKGSSLYGGCFLVGGQCVMQAVLVGNDQYMAGILKDARREKQYPSQLRDSLNAIIRFCSFCIFPAGILLFVKQFYGTGLPLNEALLSTTASMIGMIPEGLVILTTVALMSAAVKMAARAVLVQELYCTESLARVDVLCLDKTGTITSGKMNVIGLVPQPGFSQEEMKQTLSNVYHSLEDDNLTAQALRVYLQKVRPDAKADQLYPFFSNAKCSGARFGDTTYLVGAYSFIFEKEDPRILGEINRYAKKGDRVLVLAKTGLLPKLQKGNYELLGLILIEDEIRPDAASTLRYFEEQDVHIKIISGDAAATVGAIAHKAGVDGEVVDMSKVAKDEIGQVMREGTIFGRVSPDQKKWMVQALQDQGHTVGMTGDGVNDVMALKQADCSIAMGSGAQAAMAVASMVLLQDQFSVLPEIVLQGRRVINNIERTSSLFLVKTLFSFLLALLTIVWLAEYPFVPIQLTLVSSFGTGIPAFFLTFENSSERIRGNFLVRVLSRAIPGALSVCTGIALCYCVQKMPGISLAAGQYRTVCTGLAALNAVCVLYTICRPLSFQRLTVVAFSAAGLIVCMLFLPQIFMLEPLESRQFLVWLGCGTVQTLIYTGLLRLRWASILEKMHIDRLAKKQKN